MAGDSKPAVLIVGGLGYIGRYLAAHIYRNNLASEIRLVDKQLPELAWLPTELKDVCSRERFVQADASRESSIPKIFDRASGAQFDYVFNCGGETHFSQDDEVYRMRSFSLSVTLGKECARREIPAYVECSTGMVYKPSSHTPRRECDTLKPWSRLAKWRLQAAEALSKIDGLRVVGLRLANVYGPYNQGFLATTLCMARVYKELGTEMKWLWDGELRTHTVHVEDAARALWSAAEWRANWDGQTVKVGGKEKTFVEVFGNSFMPIFNIVDHGDTSQGTMAKLMNAIFDIPTGFQGKLISQFARLNLDSVCDDVNDETLDVWAELQQRDGVKAGPIGPYMESEQLKENDLSLDGRLFEELLGFKYEKERLTEAEVRSVVESFKRMSWWP